MSQVGTYTAYGVPITSVVTYNGYPLYDSVLRISDTSNSSDPINNKRRISDVEIEIADPSGTLWTGVFGTGLNCFDKEVTVNTYIGGSMSYISDHDRSVYGLYSSNGAYSYLSHTGNVANVSKANRKITFRSVSILEKVKKLRFCFPIRKTAGTILGGTLISGITFAELGSLCGYKKSDDNGTLTISAYLRNTGDFDVTDFTGTGIYDISDGTGILPFLSDSYSFTDLNFYATYPIKEIKINSNNVIIGSALNTTEEKYIYPFSKLSMQGDPSGVLRHLLIGKMVSSTWGTGYIGTTFKTAAAVTAFQTFTAEIYPNEVNVEPHISDISGACNSLFYVSNQNIFEFEPYGPKDYDYVLKVIGTENLLETEFENDINDYYNRVEFNYAWDGDDYTKQINKKAADWNIINDRPYILNTKWVLYDNQANIAAGRQLSRFVKTVPYVKFKTSMMESALNIGDLVKIDDPNSGLGSKTVQIVEYNKGFTEDKKCSFISIDGEALWKQKGYASWEDGTTLDEDVSGTSTSGWGASGTQLNINTDKYGTQFVWW